jgi:hypothetical protein
LLYRSKIAVTLLVVLVSIFPSSVFATPVTQQGNFKVSVSGTATGSIPHEIPLKMTQLPGGQLSETTGFVIYPENVVQVKQGENLMVTTSENLKVNNVKARNTQGLPVDLLPMPNNLWSLQNLVPGVYLLDVFADMSSSGILGVYETVLVILQPDQQPLPPTTVINELSIIIENGPPPPDNITTPSPEPPTPCPPDAPVSEVCPPTDEITPPPCPPEIQVNGVCPPSPEPPCPPETLVNGVCPPTDEITPVPGPPDCPEAGPELCGDEPPPEDGPDTGSDGNDNDSGSGSGNGNEDGNGEDGSNGNGDDDTGSGGGNGDSSGGGSLFE